MVLTTTVIDLNEMTVTQCTVWTPWVRMLPLSRDGLNHHSDWSVWNDCNPVYSVTPGVSKLPLSTDGPNLNIEWADWENYT